MKNIQINSKLIQQGDMFVGISCENIRNNVVEARSKGASIIFVEEKYSNAFKDIQDIIFVNDARLTTSKLAYFIYDSSPEICIGITGTNGKSSVVHFLSQIWQHAGKKSASLGTLGLYVAGEKSELQGPELTTPDAISLHKILTYLKNDGVTNFAFEASSHALDQKRLHSVPLFAAGFTNLASDHLDYHKTKEDYLGSKLKLFREILPRENPAILSIDFPEIYEAVKNINKNIISFGLSEKNSIRATKICEFSDKLTFDLIIDSKEFKNITVHLFGKFQIMNILCAIAFAIATGIESEKIINSLDKIKQLDGRMEYVCSYNDGAVYIDYAHTSEGFKNCLETFKRNCKGKLICIFGCGGDRDKTKRKENGITASELADIIIVTDDNPRTEDPASIRSEIIAACKNAVEVPDRKQAIQYGMNLIQKNDILVIIGKGHETIQIYKNETIPHNDKEEVLKIAEPC